MPGPNRMRATGSDAITFDGGGFGIGWASGSTSRAFAANQGITINSGGAFFGASAAANLLEIQSPIIDGSGGTGNGGLNVTIGSPMASPYAAGGVVNLQNTTGTANSYKGPTTVASNCKIVLGAANQIPDDSVLTLATGANVDFGGYSDTVKSLVSGGGGSLALGAGTLTLANPVDGVNAGSATISGAGGKIVMTTGTWNSSSGSCTYDGGFTLNGGTLYLRGNTALGTGKFTINSGATRVAVGDGSSARTISVAVDLAGDITFGESGRNAITFQTGAWTLKGGNRQITTDTINTTINSIIGDEGAGRKLTVGGTGTLTLGGANTYSGGTELSGGTLRISSNGSVKGNVTVTGSTLQLDQAAALESTATLTLPASPAAGTVNLNFTGTQMLGALVFGSTQQAEGTWGSLTSGAYHQSAAFTGNGIIQIGNNHAPVAQNITLPSVKLTDTARVEIIGGKLPPSDADVGDTLSVFSVQSPTASGGSAVIIESGAAILYTAPTSGSSDSFTYTVADGKSASAPATVTITSLATGGGALPNIVSPPTYADGKFSVTFAGIPNAEYTVQYAEGSPAPPWTKLKNVTAGANGLFVVEDTASESPSRYYRTVYPSY